MTGITATIARPYATAAFEYALAKKLLPAWETMLETAAIIANDPQMKKLFLNPHVTQQQLIDLFFEILAPYLDDERENFLYLLAENKRLAALPEIFSLFKEYRSEYEKNMTVAVFSALPLDATYQKKIAQALSISPGLFRQIIINNQCIFTFITEIFAHGTSRIRRNEL